MICKGAAVFKTRDSQLWRILITPWYAFAVSHVHFYFVIVYWQSLLPDQFSFLFFFFFFFLRKINPEQRKTGPEQTSVPIFFYFICGMPTTAWLAKQCHVRTGDPNRPTPGHRRGPCTLNLCATGQPLETVLTVLGIWLFVAM